VTVERIHTQTPFAELARLVQDLDLPELQTPFLVADLDVVDRNITRMAAFFASVDANLRPHFKHHKCTALARQQVAAGAIGMTCATPREAAALVAAGIDDVLVANVITDPARLAALAATASAGRVTIAVDSLVAVELASAAAQRAGTTLGVVIEVDIGMRRSGVSSAAEALALVRAVPDVLGLEYRGIMAYEGHLVSVADADQRRRDVEAAFAPLKELLFALELEGLPAEIVTSGAAATYRTIAGLPFMTEVQAGSYVFMDATYVTLAPEFEPALALVSTVATARRGRPLVVDVGAKRMATDWGVPALAGFSAEHYATSEEHCRFNVHGRLPAVGQRVAIVPAHGCVTVSMHSHIVGCRDGRCVGVLDIDGRDL
jgi:D-serine deaminase-like pyridoxal phosphate-dependent protein